MSNMKEIVLMELKKVAKREANVNSNWPPNCSFFLYEPKRPKKEFSDNNLKKNLYNNSYDC